MNTRTHLSIIGVYFLFSCLLLHEGFAHGKIIGGTSSDVWNSLWSVDFFWQKILSFELPIHTDRLNTPYGGSIWVADMLGAITMGPFVYVMGWDWGYQLWLIFSCALLGWVTHSFALDLNAKHGAWVSGMGVLVSGVFISSLHNGASEGIGLFWLVLGIWKVWRIRRNDSGGYLGLFFAVLAGLSSWYSAVLMGVFWIVLCLFEKRARLWTLLLKWVFVMLPFAYGFLTLTTGPTGLIGIKKPEVMDQVRRTIGSSSISSYVSVSSINSFSEMWRFGGDYIHSSYVGIVIFVLFCWSILRKRKDWLILSVLVCFFLSLGPVLIEQGSPVLFWDHRGIPLPYFLLEYVWGFQSLTLLYRFSFGVVLGMSLLVGQALGKKSKRVTVFAVIMMGIEFCVISPVRDFPATSFIPSSNGLEMLAKKNGGSVLNHPVESGTSYLFEQLIHHKPIYSTINVPMNSSSRDIWSRISKSGCSSFTGEKKVYLIFHLQREHRPQREDRLVQKAIEECSVLYSDQERIIVEVQ